MRYRVFPDHDDHISRYWAQFGARFSKSAGQARKAKWRGSALMAMWAAILAWHAVKAAVGGVR